MNIIYDSDIVYLREGVKEGHLYTGTVVQLKIPNLENDGIYAENKKKTYKETKELHALVISNPSSETIVPQNEETTVVLSVSSLELEELKVIPDMSTEEILKCHIVIDSKKYTVLMVSPLNKVRNTSLSYKFECREV